MTTSCFGNGHGCGGLASPLRSWTVPTHQPTPARMNPKRTIVILLTTFAALDRMMREHLEHLADMPLGSFCDGA
mgnify:CR=1 FL=1